MRMTSSERRTNIDLDTSSSLSPSLSERNSRTRLQSDSSSRARVHHDDRRYCRDRGDDGIAETGGGDRGESGFLVFALAQITSTGHRIEVPSWMLERDSVAGLYAEASREVRDACAATDLEISPFY